MIKLELPMPPPLSKLYTNVAGRGRVKTKRYRTWIRAAGNDLLATRTDYRCPVEGPFILRVYAGRPDKRPRDLDNLLNYYTDAAWLTPEEYERRSAGHRCGLCLRLWSDYAWLAGLSDRPFVPREAMPS